MSAVENAYTVPAASTSLWADKARLRRVLMFGGVGLFLAVAGGLYLAGGRYVSSDNAYIRANKLMVTTDVSGMVQSVDIREGQDVKAGRCCSRWTRSLSRSR